MTNSCTGSGAGEPAVAGGETGDGFCAVPQGMQYCHSSKEAGLFGPVFWQATPELAIAGGSKQSHLGNSFLLAFGYPQCSIGSEIQGFFY